MPRTTTTTALEMRPVVSPRTKSPVKLNHRVASATTPVMPAPTIIPARRSAILKLSRSQSLRFCALVSASHAARCVACHAFPPRTRCARRRVLHPGRVERRTPSLLVVPGELKVVALARHADSDVADAGPGVEPGAQRVSARSYEGMEHPAKPSAARRSWPRGSSMVTGFVLYDSGRSPRAPRGPAIQRPRLSALEVWSQLHARSRRNSWMDRPGFAQYRPTLNSDGDITQISP